MKTKSLQKALRDLGDSQAYEATLTWNGKTRERCEYLVQPSSKYIAYSEGHYPIITRDELARWIDGDPSEKRGWLRAAVQWVRENQRTWFQEAQEASER